MLVLQAGDQYMVDEEMEDLRKTDYRTDTSLKAAQWLTEMII